MFDTGLLSIYELQEFRSYGSKPTQKLVLKSQEYYGERTVTATRLYQARGADSSIDMIVRVPFDTEAETNWYVIPENGNQYRIDAVSKVIVGSNERALELTLVRLGGNYDVAIQPE